MKHVRHVNALTFLSAIVQAGKKRIMESERHEAPSIDLTPLQLKAVYVNIVMSSNSISLQFLVG